MYVTHCYWPGGVSIGVGMFFHWKGGGGGGGIQLREGLLCFQCSKSELPSIATFTLSGTTQKLRSNSFRTMQEGLQMI